MSSPNVTCGEFKVDTSFFFLLRSNQKIINLTFSLIFTLFFLYYLFIASKYLCNNIRQKQPSTLISWFEYMCIIVTALFISITYIFYLMNNQQYWYYKDTQQICKAKVTDNEYAITIYFSLLILMIILSTNLLTDIIDSMYIVYIIKQILRINTNNFKVLSTELNKVNISLITNKKKNIIIKIIIGFIFLLIMLFYMLTFFSVVSSDYVNVRHIINGLRILSVIELILTYAIEVMMQMNKKKLLENSYYNSNLIALKIYNIYSGRILFYTDFLSYKSIVDLISNVPWILFFFLNNLHTLPLIVSYLCLMIYVVCNGAIFIYVDKHIGQTKCSKLAKRSYLLKSFQFHFGERDKGKLYEEFDFNLSNEEKKMLNELAPININ